MSFFIIIAYQWPISDTEQEGNIRVLRHGAQHGGGAALRMSEDHFLLGDAVSPI